MSGRASKLKIGFKLYSIDILHLVDQVTEKTPEGGTRYLPADFDITHDGDIVVHVEGKEALKL